MAATFQCTLVTPEQQILDEAVTYASIPAHDGLTGIAPQRAPLLTKLGDGVLRLDFTEGGSRFFYLSGGFAQMKDNKLTILAKSAVGSEEIVRSDIEASLKEAMARQTPTGEQADIKWKQVRKARTMLGLVERVGQKV